MTTPEDTARVHIDVATAVRLVGTVVLTLAVLVGLDRSRHLLAWILTAAALALVMDGPVRLVSRLVPRGWAVAVVTVALLVALTGVGYVVADTLIAEYSRLQRITPDAAQRLAEALGRRGSDADRFVERVEELVDEGPRRLVGSPRDVTEGTLSRLAISALVLTLAVFLLASGTKALRRIALLVSAGSSAGSLDVAVGMLRGAQAARRRLGHATVLGLVVSAAGALVDLPGAQPLGLWAGLWRLLPLLGVVVAYTPFATLLLLVVDRNEAYAAIAAVLAIDAVLSWLLSRKLHRDYSPLRSVTAVALLAGFEMYGAVGALVTFVLAHTAAGAVGVVIAQREPAPAPSP